MLFCPFSNSTGLNGGQEVVVMVMEVLPAKVSSTHKEMPRKVQNKKR